MFRTGEAVSIPVRLINLDHMQPSSAGGLDSLLNYGPAHESCNKGRGNRAPSVAHRHRFGETWAGFESNGHSQLVSRMIILATGIDLDPASYVVSARSDPASHALISTELAGDLFTLRLEMRECIAGHGFHVAPDEPEFCMNAEDSEHSCHFEDCHWFSAWEHCALGGGVSRDSYPVTVFVDGIGRLQALEIARFLEAFGAAD
jgi:hypothetical protein